MYTDTQKETHGRSSSVHGNGSLEWGQTRELHRKMVKTLDRRVDFYHTQVNTHAQGTHSESMQMHTHRHTDTCMHEDNTDTQTTHTN